MVLGKIVDRFEQKYPVVVMFRALVENAVAGAFVDDLFARHACRQRPSKRLLFSTIVDLMSDTVCQIQPCLHAAYQERKPEIGVAVKSVYNKVNGVEPEVSAGLVRETAERLAAIVAALPVETPTLLPGYRVRIIDGNHLAATEHRLDELRRVASGPLPGQALVVIDPATKLFVDVFPGEDAHASERLLLQDVVETVRPDDVWIGDRHFCVTWFLYEVALRNASFVIRQHGTNVRWTTSGERRHVAAAETGEVYEQGVALDDGFGRPLTVRRITIELYQPTEQGEAAVHLLTNLPPAVDALTVARAYRERWTIEKLFWEVEAILESEIKTLAYPGAALFGFCVALLVANLLRVVQWSLSAEHGTQKVAAEVSSYYMANEIRRVWDGMETAIPGSYWKRRYGALSPEAMATELCRLSKNVDLSRLKKHRRGPKKPPPKRQSAKRRPHVSTARLIANRN